jgi:hypothetical protein
MDTKTLVVGQRVSMVCRDTWGGNGTVVNIEPWGVQIEFDQLEPAWEFRKVWSLNHYGQECDVFGVPSKLGIFDFWELKPPKE